jgi:hypothetical protein
MKNHYRFLALMMSGTIALAAPMSALCSETVSAGETAAAAEVEPGVELPAAEEETADPETVAEEPAAEEEATVEEPAAAEETAEETVAAEEETAEESAAAEETAEVPSEAEEPAAAEEEPAEAPATEDIPQEEEAEPATEGNCGEDLTWEYADGVLSIKGTGGMYDYDKEERPEWAVYAEEIKELRIGKGITQIDGDAFEDLKELKSIYFEGSEKEWKELAYENDREDGSAEEVTGTVGEDGMKEAFAGVTEYSYGEEAAEETAEEPAEEAVKPAAVPRRAAARTTAAALGLQVVAEPEDVSAAIGENVSLHVEVNMEDVYFQWQWSRDGKTWTDCTSAGNDTDTFGFVMKETLNGRKYRCIVYNDSDEIMTRVATVTVEVKEELKITKQPVNAEAAAGETVDMHVEANKADAAYQWQWSRDGKTWNNCTSAGCKTDTFSFAMKETLNGRRYRCMVTSGDEQVTSDVAVVTYKEEALEITVQPENVTAAAGDSVSMHVEANKADAAYQWQYSLNGSYWSNCKGAGYNTDTFSFTMQEKFSGRQYRCIVTSGSEELISDVAVVKSEVKLEITAQPEDLTAGNGETVEFHVKASGAGVTYQWQYSLNGSYWSNCKSSGYNTDTLSFTMQEKFSGRQYRCIVTAGSEKKTSEAATVTFAEPLEIVSQPEDAAAKNGETVSYHVKASSADVTYQWQYSLNGSYWSNCKGAGYNTDTFSFEMQEKFAGRQYRCIVKEGTQSVTTRAAQLALEDPEIVIDGVVYELIDDVMTVTGYRGSADEVVVQETVEGHTVTVIGDSAFEGSAIRTIDLPDTIQLIKKRAFANCSNLTNMN